MALIGGAFADLASAQVKLGGQTFGSVRTKPLTAAIGGGGFRFRIGGVAFGGVAGGLDGWSIVDLDYVPEALDGARLEVSLQGANGQIETVVAPVADWLLVPIARLAASDDDACLTIFGDEGDLPDDLTARERAEVQQQLEVGASIVVYHRAVAGEILGLRLLQTDILLLTADSADLFTTGAGNYILGYGESKPDVARNSKAFQRVEDWLFEQDEQYVSYVVTDSPTQPVRFSPKEGLLVLSGEPYWECWRWSAEREAAMERFQEQMFALLFEDLTETQFDARMEALSAELGEPDDDDVVVMSEFSAKLTRRIQEARGINPEVYMAARATMRYGALFRHAKAQVPDEFRAFLAEIAEVRPEPRPPVQRSQVETPGLWARF